MEGETRKRKEARPYDPNTRSSTFMEGVQRGWHKVNVRFRHLTGQVHTARDPSPQPIQAASDRAKAARQKRK